VGNAIKTEGLRRILDPRLRLDIDVTPSDPPALFLDNGLFQVVNIPAVLSGRKARFCPGLADGTPYVYAKSGERYTCVTGLAGNDYLGISIIATGYLGTQFDVMCELFDILIKILYEDGTVGDPIPILVGQTASFDFPHTGVQVCNRTAGSVGKYTFLSWQRPIVIG
jgi:hypothetical protein